LKLNPSEFMDEDENDYGDNFDKFADLTNVLAAAPLN
jgi:hypothetical protein